MNKKSIKITNIIFLIIFGILLLIPTCKINKKNEAKFYLKNFPSIYNKEGDFNQSLGQDFDAWLGSRFFTKYELMKLNTLYSCAININYCIWKDKIFDKKNALIYQKGFWGYKKDNKEEIADNIQKLNDWCKQRNIKLYILVIPRRADFMEYNVPDRNLRTSQDLGKEVITYAKEHTDANIIFPYEEMIAVNKKSPVYFKTDHHWTQTGAYVGYKALMKEIKKDFPKIFILQENNLKTSKNKLVKGVLYRDLDYGSMIRSCGYPDFYANKILNVDYLYYDIPLKKNLITTNTSDLPYFNSKTDYIFSYNGKNKKRAILIGDSFTSNLSLFLPYSFKEIVALWDNNRRLNFDEYEKIIDTYKPDIIILNMRTMWVGTFTHLSDWDIELDVEKK